MKIAVETKTLPMQGKMVDEWGVSYSYLLPLLCFIVIGLYGLTSRKHEEKFHSGQALVDL